MKSHDANEHELSMAEERLFRSLGDDGPPEGAQRAVAAALGIGTAAAITSLSAGAQGAAAGHVAGASKVAPLFIMKWIGVGVVAGTISLGAVEQVSRPSRPEMPRMTVSASSAREPAGARGQADPHP